MRIVGIAYGRPFPLFSPDEKSIVPRAWQMVHGGGLDPHWFDYPSLLMYLLAPFQSWQGAPSYLTARLVVLVLALGAIAAAWWLGTRAYGVTAGAVAAAVVAVETAEVAYSRMAVTDVPLTLGVAAALALLVGGRIELGGLVVGLATSVKYPGVLLLVPLVVAGYRQPRRLAVGAVLAAVAFCATSPFFGAHFDRYVLPLLAPLGALAGRLRALAPVTLLLLVVPLAWAVRDAGKLTKTDTRVVAQRWVETHLPHGAHLAVDPSLTPFTGFRVLQLQLPLPEEAHPDPNRYARVLLDKGVRYVIVTGAIADRVLAAPDTYPAENDFYNDLGSRAKRLFYVKEDGLNGPWVAVYR